MANTYTQIHIQFVFAPKFRAAAINSYWEPDLYKYMTGIVQNNGHKVICINGMPDHVHY
jgi:putative transposase